jgi:hypothetical protein
VTEQSYAFRVARALDRMVNAWAGGDDEETISHRVARARERGVWWGRAMCWALSQVGRVYPPWKDHCDDVLSHPNPSDALMPLEAPLKGDADDESR